MEYGLIGKTLKHSFSKPIHEKMCSYSYVLKELPTQFLFDKFMQNADFKAINVTIPYKQSVIPYCSFIDKHAQQIGAVNTIVNKNGILHGYNTDYAGFSYMARCADVSFENKTVLILGTGGTQRTVLAVLKDEKAKKIYIAGRKNKSHLNSENYVFTDYDNIKTLQNIEIIINTTPVGMYPNNLQAPINLLLKPDGENYIYPNLQAVLDVIYNPQNTTLIMQARQRGIAAVNGLTMLVAQAKCAAEIFSNSVIADEEIEKTAKYLSAKMANIVLVGMPGSGKSHIGTLLANALKRPFIDTDTLCVQRAGMSIQNLFEQQGEQAFRNLESEICEEISKHTGAVIATGGGAILRQSNIDALLQNGIVIYINRPLENLQKGKGRPLSTDENALALLFEKREPIYKKIADITIENTVSAQKAAKDCEEKFHEFAYNKRP